MEEVVLRKDAEEPLELEEQREEVEAKNADPSTREGGDHLKSTVGDMIGGGLFILIVIYLCIPRGPTSHLHPLSVKG